MGKDFFGWYFKCQSDGRTLAVIPAVHKTSDKKSCSIQLITDSGSWNVNYPFEDFQKSGSGIQIGRNRFCRHGISLDIASPKLSVNGLISFGDLTPIRYDIMGPFRFVPFMECRHSVVSMKHAVNGALTVNGAQYVFTNGMGYWEGDRGRSFPKEYAWTQCFFPDGSLMLSVADIPMLSFSFTGIIGVIYWKGKEYRLATYLGARARRIGGGKLVIRQGDKQLFVKLLEKTAQPLRAPKVGSMERTIHENASCRAFYSFCEKGRTLFSFEASDASFEYEYPW